MGSHVIAVGCDHGGFELKLSLLTYLIEAGHEVIDLGCDNAESVDYPDYAHALGDAIEEGRAGRGILICGSGIGMSIAANRHTGIRAALIHDALGARLCRQHNNANVICLGARMIGVDLALDCLSVFLETKFEGGRHVRRIEKF